MAAPLYPSRQQQPAQSLSRSAIKARNALVLGHLPLADAIASATTRRLGPLVEREDLIQVAREALVRSAPRYRAGEPAGPYLRRCITGGLQHHVRDLVRLVRISRPEHEKGQCPLGHNQPRCQSRNQALRAQSAGLPKARAAGQGVIAAAGAGAAGRSTDGSPGPIVLRLRGLPAHR